jgi:hypothetical protein
MLERNEFAVLLVADQGRTRAADQTLQTIVDEVVTLGHVVVNADTLSDDRSSP